MRSARRNWLSLHTLLVFAFLYLPIVTLIVYSFNGAGVVDSLRATSPSTGIANFFQMTLSGHPC